MKRGSGAERPRREALPALFARAFDDMGAAAEDWRQNANDETLHEFRVALRRFRVLFRIFEEKVAALHAARLLSELARLGDQLGAVRDWDVMIALVEKMKPGDAALQQRLVAVMRDLQRVPRRAAERFMRGPAWERVMKNSRAFLKALARDPVTADSIKKFHDRAFRRQCRRILRAESLARSAEAEMLHAFRIKLRRLRYLGDMLDAYCGRRQRKTVTAVRAAEQVLGRLHDLDLAIHFAGAHPGLKAGPAVAIWQAARGRRLEKFRRRWKKARTMVADAACANVDS